MKTTTIDRELLKLIRPEIDAALKAVADKFGISIKAGKAAFSAMNATFKLELAVISENGDVVNKDAERFDKYAHLVGLLPEHRGAQVQLGAASYKITGLKSVIDGKFPIIAQRTDGKSFCLSVSAVKSALNIKN